jgi:hypothetical protein
MLTIQEVSSYYETQKITTVIKEQSLDLFLLQFSLWPLTKGQIPMSRIPNLEFPGHSKTSENSKFPYDPSQQIPGHSHRINFCEHTTTVAIWIYFLTYKHRIKVKYLL